MSTETVFSPGDVVQLKLPAFSPLMVIESVEKDENIVCVWFDKTSLIRASVKASTIEKTRT